MPLLPIVKKLNEYRSDKLNNKKGSNFQKVYKLEVPPELFGTEPLQRPEKVNHYQFSLSEFDCT